MDNTFHVHSWHLLPGMAQSFWNSQHSWTILGHAPKLSEEYLWKYLFICTLSILLSLLVLSVSVVIIVVCIIIISTYFVWSVFSCSLCSMYYDLLYLYLISIFDLRVYNTKIWRSFFVISLPSVYLDHANNCKWLKYFWFESLLIYHW